MSTFLTDVTTGLPAAAGSAAANGYTYLPGGLILNWNTLATANSTAQAITYPLPFPTGPLASWGQGEAANNGVIIASGNTTGANVTGGSAVSNVAVIFVLGH
jgi:hypothetical protein